LASFHRVEQSIHENIVLDEARACHDTAVFSPSSMMAFPVFPQAFPKIGVVDNPKKQLIFAFQTTL